MNDVPKRLPGDAVKSLLEIIKVDDKGLLVLPTLLDVVPEHEDLLTE